jgi:hypothetical protein
MMPKFDVTAAYRRYNTLMAMLDVKPHFTFDELKMAIERLREKDIEIAALPMPGNIYGSAKLAAADYYIISYNQALDERLSTRTILHELAHIARGDVEKSKEKICYISRENCYSVLEFDVEFICSMWLEQMVKGGPERAGKLWFDGD